VCTNEGGGIERKFKGSGAEGHTGGVTHGLRVHSTPLEEGKGIRNIRKQKVKEKNI
jgi:hypothetical protein